MVQRRVLRPLSKEQERYGGYDRTVAPDYYQDSVSRVDYQSIPERARLHDVYSKEARLQPTGRRVYHEQTSLQPEVYEEVAAEPVGATREYERVEPIRQVFEGKYNVQEDSRETAEYQAQQFAQEDRAFEQVQYSKRHEIDESEALKYERDLDETRYEDEPLRKSDTMPLIKYRKVLANFPDTVEQEEAEKVNDKTKIWYKSKSFFIACTVVIVAIIIAIVAGGIAVSASRTLAPTTYNSPPEIQEVYSQSYNPMDAIINLLS